MKCQKKKDILQDRQEEKQDKQKEKEKQSGNYREIKEVNNLKKWFQLRRLKKKRMKTMKMDLAR